MYLTCRMMHIFTLPGDKIWLAFGDDTVIIFNNSPFKHDYVETFM